MTSRVDREATFGAPFRIAVLLVKRLAIQTFLITLLIEGVYLIERLNFLLDAAIDRVASFTDMALLLILDAPAILPLALPGALLVSFYRVFLRAREENELVVLSGAGVGFHQLIPACVTFVVAILVMSVLTSAFLVPWTHHAYRETEQFAKYQSFMTGGHPGILDRFVDYAVYVTRPVNLSESSGPLLVQKRSDDRLRITVPEHATLESVDTSQVLLKLHNFNAYDVSLTKAAHPDGTRAYTSELTSTSHVRGLDQLLSLQEILPFGSVEATPSEWSWAGYAPSEERNEPADVFAWRKQILQRLGRNLLCLETPLLALLALLWARRGTEPLILPITFVLTLAGDVATQSVGNLLAGFGLLSASCFLFGMSALLIAGACVTLRARARSLIMRAI